MRDTIDMAREAGLLTWLKPPEDVIERFKAFEALVIANIDPSSWMSFQEGLEAGRLAEREACAKVCDHMATRCNDIRAAALESAAENIRARGNT